MYSNFGKCFRLTACAVLAVMAGSVSGTDFKTDSSFAGVRAGLNLGGDFSIGRGSISSARSFTVGVFGDRRLKSNVFGGASFDLHNFAFSGGSATMFDLSLGLKAMLSSPESNVILSPGLSIGCGLLGRFGEIEGSSYLTLKASLEAIVLTNTDVAWLLDGTVFGAPIGGWQGIDISIGPVFLLRAGILF